MSGRPRGRVELSRRERLLADAFAVGLILAGCFLFALLLNLIVPPC